MNNVWWSEAEVADVGLSWSEFHCKHEARSYHAWRAKRKDVAERRAVGLATIEKVVPEIDDAPDAETAKALLEQSDSRLFDAYLGYHEEVSRAFPFAQDVSVGIDAEEPIAVCLMSDWHIGSEGTDLRRLKSDIDLIASHPRLYVGLGGDVCDNFILEKMASAARTQTAQVQVQWRLFRYLMQPLLESNSLLWVSSGNHDQWTETVAAIDPILSALGTIPTSYIGEGGFVDLRIGPKSGTHQTYTIWRKHRPVRYRSSFHRTHFLKRFQELELTREFDIGISEHFHTMELNKWWYRNKQRVLVNTGSYKVRDRWAEGGGFYSAGYGVPVIVLYPDSRRMLDFASIQDALETLDGPRFSVA